MSDQNLRKRVVITGVGIFSPIGIGVEPFWQGLVTGKSGIHPIDGMSCTALPQNVGSEVKEFTESSAKKVYLKQQRKSIKVMCREVQLGVASAKLAVENSGLDVEQIDRGRLGVDFGANQMFSPPQALLDGCNACIEGDDRRFNFEKWGTRGLGGMEPLWLLKYLPNMPACHIAIAADARGPNNSLTHAEASANLAMGEAFRIIVRGSADMMIAGSTGSRLHPTHCMHAVLWDDLAHGENPPEQWCRPFDLHRTGQILGEGSCSFIFEEESHARNRNATILGTILGTGSSCVIDRQGRANICAALIIAMRNALSDADLSPADVGHVNAHGLGTIRCDINEAAAIHNVFGKRAETVPVTALKSCLGNSGAGAGTLELAGSLMALKHGFVPATLNYESPDPACILNIVHTKPLPMTNKIVLNINVTSQGQASALVVCGA